MIGAAASKDKSHVVRRPVYVIPSVKNRQLSTSNNGKMDQIGSFATPQSPTDHTIASRNCEINVQIWARRTWLPRYLPRFVGIESGAFWWTWKNQPCLAGLEAPMRSWP